jgi:hypothetical protein
MKVTISYTHKGWFGLCPVYFANLDSESPNVEPRHWSLAWIMDFSEAMFFAVNWMRSLIDPTHEPGWPLKITGQLNPAKVREHEYN